MVTRFNFIENIGEQKLLDDLNRESIQIAGIDMFYLPRTRNQFDKIYGADDQSSFNNAYLLEFYTQSFEGFTGDKEFMSKFGLEIRDQMFLSCSSTRFMEEVGTPYGLPRPREADLIYFPLYGSCFEIKHVTPRENFYPLGFLATYQCTVELFEVSSEIFDTKIPEIDKLQKEFSMDAFNWAYLDENGNALLDEEGNVLTVEEFQVEEIDVLSDNDTLMANVVVLADWSEINPFGDLDTLP